MSLDQQCPTAENSSSQLKGRKLLVIDDNLDTRALFSFILEDYGAEVITATSAEEALEAIRQSKPDLLISDINLIGEDGYSLIRRVRSLRPEQGGQVPAIAVTGLLPESDHTTGTNEFQLHLTKPVDVDELVRAAVMLTKK